MMPEELRKGITSNPVLGFEHGNSCWGDLGEQKVMEISRRGFEMMEESEILMPHPFKRYLRGWVCYIPLEKSFRELHIMSSNSDSVYSLVVASQKNIV
jgi:hypothetical protein